MIEFVSFIKGNGLSGLALVLVYFLNQDVQNLKAELTDCNKEKVEIMKPFVRPTATNHNEKSLPILAILPENIKIKEDEKG